MKGGCKTFPTPKQEEDSVTIIANPVSGTKYVWRTGTTGAGAELGAQKNVRILAITGRITWAVTQPTPLEVHVTIDGQTIIHTFTDPVTNVYYLAYVRNHLSKDNQGLIGLTGNVLAEWKPAFLTEGRSVKIEVEITWAVTQPTDLTMRVKWAKW